MLESSFRLGTVFGIRIGVHYTWVIVFFLLISSLFAVFRNAHSEWSSHATLLTALLATLLFFVSIILHELGHSLIAIARGIKVRAITLFVFGGVAQTEKDADTAATEFFIAIAGPLVSFALAGLFYLLKLWLMPYSETATAVLDWLTTINLVVAIFNLIPGFPMDGGRVFRALVWRITGNAVKGMEWAVMSGKIVAYGLMVTGMLVALQPAALINGLWLIGISWFLLAVAEDSKRAYFREHLAGHVSVGDVTQKEVPTIAADMSILDWIDKKMLLTGHRACLVIKDNQTIGLVSLSDIVKCPREQWSSTPVREIMTPLKRLYIAKPNNSILEVLQIMNEYGINQVPVVDEGKIVGWIDREHILKILQLHIDTGR
ncbi:site-2 protease family protein [Nitrosomonas sp. Is37]|uniref:site-2 protease family protein n=1 Tax=Nitrosomonas sp. Is37 TaxID=3080535 RepID=UPI00294AD8F3|nr:site-2 protease family protein [Nitrosomonas sp. Is37]MDV6343789.1 site-2 protease family protein [Nitrosomonas sp. Is37]